MGKNLKISCDFKATEQNYPQMIEKLETIIQNIKDKFEQKCIYLACVCGKYANVYVFNYDKDLYETLDYNLDFFTIEDGNVILETDYLSNIKKKIEDDYFRNALDISWYRGIEVDYLVDHDIIPDIIDHKITREYSTQDMVDFFTNGDITEDEDSDIEIPFN